MVDLVFSFLIVYSAYMSFMFWVTKIELKTDKDSYESRIKTLNESNNDMFKKLMYCREEIARLSLMIKLNKNLPEKNNGFTSSELTYILKRVHPDRNENSSESQDLTRKLIAMRKS